MIIPTARAWNKSKPKDRGMTMAVQMISYLEFGIEQYTSLKLRLLCYVLCENIFGLSNINSNKETSDGSEGNLSFVIKN